MQPPEPQPEDTEPDGEKPPGYDEIYRSIGEDRTRMLFELADAEEPVKASELKSEEMADIPSGSMLSNIKWLQGEDVRGNPLREWPEETPPLIETVGRETPRGGGQPTRVLALTEMGERFVDHLREDTMPEPQDQEQDGEGSVSNADLADIQMSIKTQSDRIDELETRMDNVSETVSELESDVQENANVTGNVLDYIEEIQAELGIEQASSR